MNTNKILLFISIGFFLIMSVIAILNKNIQTNIIKIDKNAVAIPFKDYNLDIKKVGRNDIIAKIKVTHDIKQGNNSIFYKAEVTNIFQGDIDSNLIDIYTNQIFQQVNKKQYFSLYSYNLFRPKEEYIVILEKLPKKFFYMNENSYRLKDDLSVFNKNLNYLLIKDDKEIDLEELKNYLYLFTNEEQVKQYQSRASLLKDNKL
ncbi:hypothetical protein H5P36_21085 [Bacillus sp. APMAM]|nr:hypothetical protein [Bacillus sp. APMAM]RTZ53898.1 hypothetical protein EKO25_20835 [Bacillus sp. SAJ1]